MVYSIKSFFVINDSDEILRFSARYSETIEYNTKAWSMQLEFLRKPACSAPRKSLRSWSEKIRSASRAVNSLYRQLAIDASVVARVFYISFFKEGTVVRDSPFVWDNSSFQIFIEKLNKGIKRRVKCIFQKLQENIIKTRRPADLPHFNLFMHFLSSSKQKGSYKNSFAVFDSEWDPIFVSLVLL